MVEHHRQHISPQPALVLSQGAWTCQRSVRFEDFICTRTFHDGYHDLPESFMPPNGTEAEVGFTSLMPMIPKRRASKADRAVLRLSV